MPSSFPRLTGLDYSATPLRAETARLTRDACDGIAKMVAAALNVGRSRIDKQNDGTDANYLELVARMLDRIEKEAGSDRVKPILRWLTARYGYSIGAIAATHATGEEVERSVARGVTVTSNAFAKTIIAAVDGIDDTERPDVALALRQGIEALTDTLNKVEAAPAKAAPAKLSGAIAFGRQS